MQQLTAQDLARIAQEMGGTVTPPGAPPPSSGGRGGGAGAVGSTVPGTDAPKGKDDPADASFLGDVKSLLTGVWDVANPLNLVNAVLSPVHTASALYQAHKHEFEEAKRFFSEGDIAGGIAHTMTTIVPVLGPQVAASAKEIAEGNTLRGLGQLAGTAALMKPGIVTKPAQLLSEGALNVARKVAPAATERLASIAEQAATKKIVQAMSPTTGPNKRRFVGAAKKAAPDVLSEPDMGALSRGGLQQKASARLDKAAESLDEADAVRNPKELIDVSSVKAALHQKLSELTGQAAEGADAHALAKLLEGPKPPPPAPKGPVMFKNIPGEHQAELRRMLAEMDEFQYQRHIGDEEFETAQGFKREDADPGHRAGFQPGTAGAPVFHEIMQGKGGTRASVAASLRKYEEGGNATALVRRAIEVADQRLRGTAVSRPMLPDGHFNSPPESGPVGENVLFHPNQHRASAIYKALEELDKLGPVAPFETLLKMRQSYDQIAKPQYNLAKADDFLRLKGESAGAADVTGVIRETLAAMDPARASAAKDFSIWKRVNEVLEAADEADMARPQSRGTRIASRIASTTAGASAGGGFGAAAGFLLAPFIDGMVNSGATTKIMVARGLDRLQKALRSGDVGQIEIEMKKLRALQTVVNAGQKKDEK